MSVDTAQRDALVTWCRSVPAAALPAGGSPELTMFAKVAAGVISSLGLKDPESAFGLGLFLAARHPSLAGRLAEALSTPGNPCLPELGADLFSAVWDEVAE